MSRYFNQKDYVVTPWYQLVLAKIFGKKKVAVDDDGSVITYIEYKNKIIITGFNPKN